MTSVQRLVIFEAKISQLLVQQLSCQFFKRKIPPQQISNLEFCRKILGTLLNKGIQGSHRRVFSGEHYLSVSREKKWHAYFSISFLNLENKVIIIVKEKKYSLWFKYLEISSTLEKINKKIMNPNLWTINRLTPCATLFKN